MGLEGSLVKLSLFFGLERCWFILMYLLSISSTETTKLDFYFSKSEVALLRAQPRQISSYVGNKIAEGIISLELELDLAIRRGLVQFISAQLGEKIRMAR